MFGESRSSSERVIAEDAPKTAALARATPARPFTFHRPGRVTLTRVSLPSRTRRCLRGVSHSLPLGSPIPIQICSILTEKTSRDLHRVEIGERHLPSLSKIYQTQEAALLSSLRRSTSRSEFIPVVDGLRFLAIVPVVVHHFCARAIRISEERNLATQSDYALIKWLPNSNLGVELFFVISGLIISYPFISAHFRGEPRPSVRSFYLRRVTRLEPPYFLVMIGCYLFLRLTGYTPEAINLFSHGSISLEASLAASLIYMHGILFAAPPKLNPPAWSLEIEIQFYILAPIVLLTLLRMRRSAAVALGIFMLIAGSILASHLLEMRFPSWDPGLTKFFHLFLAGILINLLIVGGLVPQQISRIVWDAGFVVAITFLYIFDKNDGSILASVAQVPCYLILFLAAFQGKFFRRFLSLPWIFTIGGMCYTIYLIHLPILQVLIVTVMRISGVVSFIPGLLISVVVVLPVLFIVSIAFFLLIEKPCMNPEWPLRAATWIGGRAVQVCHLASRLSEGRFNSSR
jgi:peptidoglycan/LPS O-acetylase OafA/YrhL